MIKDIAEVKECPDCASVNIVTSKERDQVVCKDCGLVFEPMDPETEAKFEKTHDLTMGAKPKKKK
ncbi:hypothetical protein HY492_03770 [Candidatus Woesearchaeota archaeon]|nr:hypothetical protein [Candidatus Woesearchaeota archaeon]